MVDAEVVVQTIADEASVQQVQQNKQTRKRTARMIEEDRLELALDEAHTAEEAEEEDVARMNDSLGRW